MPVNPVGVVIVASPLAFAPTYSELEHDPAVLDANQQYCIPLTPLCPSEYFTTVECVLLHVLLLFGVFDTCDGAVTSYANAGLVFHAL